MRVGASFLSIAACCRVRNGGLEIVGRDGVAVDGDPAPPSEYVDRILALDGLVDAPTFDVPTVDTDALSIRPVDSVEVGTETTPSESSAVAPAESNRRSTRIAKLRLRSPIRPGGQRRTMEAEGRGHGCWAPDCWREHC